MILECPMIPYLSLLAVRIAGVLLLHGRIGQVHQRVADGILVIRIRTQSEPITA